MVIKRQQAGGEREHKSVSVKAERLKDLQQSRSIRQVNKYAVSINKLKDIRQTMQKDNKHEID